MSDKIKNIGMERFNYVLSKDGNYCANSVNTPVIVQAKNMEQMKRKSKVIFKMWINHLQEVLDNDLFDFVDETEINPLTNG